MKKIAVFVSGRGSNLVALHKAILDGKLQAEIAMVISNRSKAKAIEYCKEKNIPFEIFKKKDYPDRESLFENIGELIDSLDVDLLVHAGFMLLTPDNFTEKYYGKMINIHPALLPSFPGLHVQKKAIEYGVKLSGCTVFFVDSGCDTGPIIIQKTVPVLERDTEETLSARILKEEHNTLWRACKLVLEGRTEIDGRRVRITEEK